MTDREKLDRIMLLLHDQIAQHQLLIAPTHPDIPVLIEVSRVLAILDEE